MLRDREGDIQFCLEEAIAKYDTDLVVIGTRGRTGLGKMLLGSVAEEILYATDLALPSPAAATYAISLAQEFQARLILLHVIAEPKAGELVSAHDSIEASKNLLRKLVPAEAEAWCKPEFFVERGNPGDRILELAHLRESGLIVLGAKAGEGVPGAATHLPIATAHKIVSHAECPVLTVRS